MYVGSLTTGEILRQSPTQRKPETFVASGGDIIQAVGLLVDEARKLLWVCSVDLSNAQPPRIVAVDQTTGQVRAKHNMTGFCNDLTLDNNGNLYATNSFGSQLYRVPAAQVLQNNSATVWKEDPLFAIDKQGDFGLNGIVYNGKDALYTVHTARGTFLRIPIQNDGSAGTVVQITLSRSLVSGDGLKMINDTTFVVAENFADRLSSITLNGNQATVRVLSSRLDKPTTFAVYAGSAWVVEGQLDHLFGADPNPPALPFLIRRVDLPFVMPLSSFDMIGRWKSESCETLQANGQTNYLTRDFIVSDRRWWLEFTIHADKDCKNPLFSSRINGPYTLLGFSKDVPAATQGNFSYTSIQFIAHTEDFAKTFTQSQCGTKPWVVGVPQEVGGTGCIGVAPKIADCPTDHDIVKIEGDKLFFGTRETDMCKPEGRPKKLNVPVIREK